MIDTVEKILLCVICSLKWFVRNIIPYDNVITELQNNSRIMKYVKLQYLLI